MNFTISKITEQGVWGCDLLSKNDIDLLITTVWAKEDNPYGEKEPILSDPNPSSQYYASQLYELSLWQEAEDNRKEYSIEGDIIKIIEGKEFICSLDYILSTVCIGDRITGQIKEGKIVNVKL